MQVIATKVLLTYPNHSKSIANTLENPSMSLQQNQYPAKKSGALHIRLVVCYASHHSRSNCRNWKTSVATSFGCKSNGWVGTPWCDQITPTISIDLEVSTGNMDPATSVNTNDLYIYIDFLSEPCGFHGYVCGATSRMITWWSAVTTRLLSYRNPLIIGKTGLGASFLQIATTRI